jgi:hypothetical protein
MISLQSPLELWSGNNFRSGWEPPAGIKSGRYSEEIIAQRSKCPSVSEGDFGNRKWISLNKKSRADLYGQLFLGYKFLSLFLDNSLNGNFMIRIKSLKEYFTIINMSQNVSSKGHKKE